MTPITTPAEWKAALTSRLASHNLSRYAFVRQCHAAQLCSLHTAECVLAGPDTVTGQRVPSLPLALDMARLAGFDVVLVPRRNVGQARRPRRPRQKAAPAPSAV